MNDQKTDKELKIELLQYLKDFCVGKENQKTSKELCAVMGIKAGETQSRMRKGLSGHKLNPVKLKKPNPDIRAISCL